MATVMPTLLFPGGVRLSTLLTAVVFVGLAIARKERALLWAGAAWLTGFEAAFQVASLVVGKLQHGLPAPVFFIGLGALTIWWTRRAGVRIDWRPLAISVTLIAVWLATGFHLNGHEQGMFTLHPSLAGFDPAAEALNEAAKSLWALAYLLPLLRRNFDAQRSWLFAVRAVPVASEGSPDI